MKSEKQGRINPGVYLATQESQNAGGDTPTHKKKLALKSFQHVIKRTASIKIGSLYL